MDWQTEGVESDFAPDGASGLSALYINTGDRTINSREQWLENVEYTLLDSAGRKVLEGKLDVKGRGNSTWNMPKKPLSIKLAQETAWFDMPAHRRWNLLANFADKSLLRTEVAFKLGNLFDQLAWTPHSAQLDLYLNGSYEGVYQLTEAIDIHPNRVNIHEIGNDNAQGGFILETDWRNSERYHFTTDKGLNLSCAEPDLNWNQVVPDDTISWLCRVKQAYDGLEKVVYSSNFCDSLTGYQTLLDVPSMIDWYLVNELTKNVDAAFGLSVFLYFDDQKGKFCMGPLWDFDYALGNVDYADSRFPQGFWIRNSYLVSRLFEDKHFEAAVKSRWLQKRNELASIFPFIEERRQFLNRAQAFNFRKWTILDKHVANAAYILGGYTMQVDTLNRWLKERIDWMDQQMK